MAEAAKEQIDPNMSSKATNAVKARNEVTNKLKKGEEVGASAEENEGNSRPENQPDKKSIKETEEKVAETQPEGKAHHKADEKAENVLKEKLDNETVEKHEKDPVKKPKDVIVSSHGELEIVSTKGKEATQEQDPDEGDELANEETRKRGLTSTSSEDDDPIQKEKLPKKVAQAKKRLKKEGAQQTVAAESKEETRKRKPLESVDECDFKNSDLPKRRKFFALPRKIRRNGVYC